MRRFVFLSSLVATISLAPSLSSRRIFEDRLFASDANAQKLARLLYFAKVYVPGSRQRVLFFSRFPSLCLPRLLSRAPFRRPFRDQSRRRRRCRCLHVAQRVEKRRILSRNYTFLQAAPAESADSTALLTFSKALESFDHKHTRDQQW